MKLLTFGMTNDQLDISLGSKSSRLQQGFPVIHRYSVHVGPSLNIVKSICNSIQRVEEVIIVHIL